jgi:histidyl-tRNA synthetase
VIIGSEEAAAQKSSLKELKTGEQVEVSLENLAEEIKRKLA